MYSAMSNDAVGMTLLKNKYNYYFYCSVLREQWIRAKYQRLEFVEVDKQTYLQGHKEGYLWKRGKEDKKFLQRKFILDEKSNTLKYYNKEDVCCFFVGQ